jgi:hypothetical protein
LHIAQGPTRWARDPEQFRVSNRFIPKYYGSAAFPGVVLRIVLRTGPLTVLGPALA